MREETGETLQANDYGQIRWRIDQYLSSGFHLTNDRLYKHLHHSQSQLKDKQFWFYWHDEKNKTNLSFEDAYKWMGDFSHERVVAKHSARMAQCFTSSAATIRVDKTNINRNESIHLCLLGSNRTNRNYRRYRTKWLHFHRWCWNVFITFTR